MSRQGKIIPNGVSLEKHEMNTIIFFTNRGKNIELIPPRHTYGKKSADIIMENIPWEIKSPCGKGKYLIRDTLDRASKQSPNIIIDLRRTKLHPAKCLRDLEKYFRHYKNIRRLHVVTKENHLLTYVK